MSRNDREKLRLAEAVGFYRAIVLELERARAALGWPMDKLSEFAGAQ